VRRTLTFAASILDRGGSGQGGAPVFAGEAAITLSGVFGRVDDAWSHPHRMMPPPGARATIRSMMSRYDRPPSISTGRAVGWFLAASSLFWPRLFILLFWIFDDQLFRRAFGPWIVPVLGFLVLPWTTLAYATMWGLWSDRVSGAEWIGVGIGLVLDIWTYAGIRRLWTT
jgi:hypothetical protein